jgi:dolichol-phosphate mannosyltransferase
MIAVVIPCFKVKQHILTVIEKIGDEVQKIYVIDDACPEKTGDYVELNSIDRRLIVIRHKENQGVGGAVMTGYRAAIEDGNEIIVKIDGDGQMNPELINTFVQPILDGEADYSKGNRFYNLQEIHKMPLIRLLGNAILSFITKISSGYWDLFDPTNGFTAIHSNVARALQFEKISKRYFFETDMLFQLNILRAVVVDIPMDAIYLDEKSNLRISKIFGEFILKHLRNFFRRIFYNYYLRDMSLASLELIMGMVLITWGAIYGAYHWISSMQVGIQTPAGTVMLSALPIIVGIQFLLAFIGYDISFKPRRPFHLSGRFYKISNNL